jgi:hypothetical protein
MPAATQVGTQNAAHRIEQDAALEGVEPRLAWAIFWLPLAGLAALLVAALIFRPSFDRMLQEDYPVEWAQFACCVFVSVVSTMTAYYFARQRQYLIAITLLLLGVGTFVLAGEEISWGQRVLGLATPEELGEVNHQAELNVHNITGGFDVEAAFRTVSLLIGIVGTVLPFLARPWSQRPVLTANFWRVLSPPLFTVPLFAMMIGYRIFRLIVTGEVNFAVRLQEWIECCQYFGLVITVTCIHLRARQAETAGAWTNEPLPTRWQVGRLKGDPEVRPLILIVGAILLVTAVFAVFSALSGVRPGNAL